MSKIALDLKKFKHVKSDEHTATLRHKDGHELRIAIKALSPEFKEQLQALAPKMATGGRVKVDVPAEKDGDAQTASGERPVSNQWKGMDTALQNLKDAAGELVGKPRPKPSDRRGYAEGGDVNSEKQDILNNVAVPIESLDQRLKAIEQAAAPYINQNQVQQLDPKTGQPQSNIQPPSMAQIGQDVRNTLMAPAGSPDPGMPQAPEVVQNQEQQAPQTPEVVQPQQPAAPANPDPMGNEAYMDNMQGGLKMQQDALKEQFNAAKQQGQDKAVADAAYQAQLKQIQSDFEKQNAMDNQNIQNTIADIQANHINPRAYMENMSTGSKVASAIGLMAGGFGSAFTHQANPAMEFLNKQIDRDIAAQVNNQNNKQTLLNAYQHQYQNHNAAVNMTKATLQNLYASQLSLAANNAATPQAKAMMLMGAGQLQMKSAELVKQATLTKFLNQGSNKPEDMINAIQQSDPKRADELRGRLIPGVGFANTPDDAKHLKEVQDRHKAIQNNVKEAIRLVKEKGTYEMFGAHNADLDRLADQIATDMAKMQDPATAARPGEVEMVKKTLMNSGIKTQNKTAIDQMNHFLKGVNQRRDQQFETRGLKPPDPAMNLTPEQKAIADWAKKNPQDPRSRLALEKLGIQ